MNNIHATAIVYPGVKLGDGITIRAYAVVGSPAEKHGHFEGPGKGVEIGDNTIISEFVTVHSGTERVTKIGKGVIMLRGSHCGHDSEICDNAVISCNALIGGHSLIGQGANLGLNSVLHQFSNVGAWSFVGMSCVVPKNKRIVPGQIYIGSPARSLKPNTIGLQRAGITTEQIQAARQAYFSATSDWKN